MLGSSKVSERDVEEAIKAGRGGCLLTIAEVTRYLSISLRTFHRWRDSGYFPPPCRVFPGQSPRWTPKALADFANGTLERSDADSARTGE